MLSSPVVGRAGHRMVIVNVGTEERDPPVICTVFPVTNSTVSTQCGSTERSVIYTVKKSNRVRYFDSAYSVSLSRRSSNCLDTAFENYYKPCCVITHVRTLTNFPLSALSPAGIRLYDTPNAGGASVHSEVMSIELLQRMCKATLIATETEVTYWPPNGPITDYVCRIGSTPFGVSVTRAFHYRGSQYFTDCDAATLLNKKLQGVINSTTNVLFPGFSKQILHVWCQSDEVAQTVRRQYKRLSSVVRANTIVILTVCDAVWIYKEKRTSEKKPSMPKVIRPFVRRDPNSRKSKKRRARWVRKQIANSILTCIAMIMYSGMLWQAWLMLCTNDAQLPSSGDRCVFLT